MHEILEEIFKDDPIRKEITINKLEDELFTDSILEMHHETTYSTVDTGRIIGRPDSTIRNYFRTDLLQYIEPVKFGKYYRLDYKSVFKMHMILLLIEKAGKSTSDIAYFVGITPGVSVSKTKRTGFVVNNNEESLTPDIITDADNRISRLEQLMQYTQMKLMYKEEEGALISLENKIELCGSEIESIKLKITQKEQEIKIKQVESKYYRVLDLSLRKAIKQNVPKQTGFFSSLFGSSKSNEPELDMDELLAKAQKTAEQEVAAASNEILEKQIDDLNKEFEAKQRVKEDLQEKYEKQKKRLIELKENNLKKLQSPDMELLSEDDL